MLLYRHNENFAGCLCGRSKFTNTCTAVLYLYGHAVRAGFYGDVCGRVSDLESGMPGSIPFDKKQFVRPKGILKVQYS